MIFTYTFHTPFGELILGDYENNLVLSDWKYRKMRTQIDLRIKNYLQCDFIEKQTGLHQLVMTQLEAYFVKKLTVFSISLLTIGTPFQKRVWQELTKIPYGKTASYLELSKAMENEKAIRAVASANGANALSIIIPCHRIIGNKGELIGYAGGVDTKRKLLSLENSWNQTSLNLE
jgi:methylated-DNA-[protein]-cysteine S-methyltransferase